MALVKPKSIDNDVVELITRRRILLLGHARAYYAQHEKYIEDATWDSFKSQLLDLQDKYPEESKLAKMHDEFIDFQTKGAMCLDINSAQATRICTNVMMYNKLIEKVEVRNREATLSKGLFRTPRKANS